MSNTGGNAIKVDNRVPPSKSSVKVGARIIIRIAGAAFAHVCVIDVDRMPMDSRLSSMRQSMSFDYARIRHP
jgi:hypothetical protein